jgi:protocatechuate 3,4-dioxygenase beta subunit
MKLLTNPNPETIIYLKIQVIIILLIFTKVCLSQSAVIGGRCDGCELMYIGMPNNISATSYSPAWSSDGQKLLVTGKTLKIDGSPVANVIVYYWQTDNTGYYTPKDYLDDSVKRHGYIRGWVKSDSQGNYAIYTIKPKAYPNRDIPAHIHLSIKEEKRKNEYYVDGLVFDYDPLLTTAKRKKLENRGGSGILRTLVSDDMLISEHNIVLGLNIPNYPKTEINQLQSGQKIGEDFHSITPFHAWGADTGQTTCPVCRYGRYFGIMYFVNEIESQEVKEWLLYLEQLSHEYGKQLKVYLIYANHENYSYAKRNKQLAEFGKQLNLKQLALTFVPSFQDISSDIYLSKINPDVKNTFIIYRNRNIISKFINLSANQNNFQEIKRILKINKSDYFDLPIDKSM